MKWLSVLQLFAATMLLQCFVFEKSTDSPTGLPVLTTSAVINITQNSAECGGIISTEGETAVTQRGICYGLSQTPTVADTKSTNGAGPGGFTCGMSGLTSNTVYYVRAFATNSVGTGYGGILSFTTQAGMAGK